MKWVRGCIDDNVWVGGVVKVPVANSHVTASSQDELVLVTHADVHSVHAVLRRLPSNNTTRLQPQLSRHQWRKLRKFIKAHSHQCNWNELNTLQHQSPPVQFSHYVNGPLVSMATGRKTGNEKTAMSLIPGVNLLHNRIQSCHSPGWRWEGCLPKQKYAPITC